MNKEPTHKVVITVTSYKDDPYVHMEVEYGPTTDDLGEEEYSPAAYEFVQRALMAAVAESEYGIEAGDMDDNRSLN